MRTTTPDDLAYGLKYALEHGTFAQPDRLRLQHLLTRWDAQQQRQGDPGAAIVRQWNCDRDTFLGTLDQLDEAGIYQMAAAAVAFHRKHGGQLTVDQQLAAWQAAAQQCAVGDGSQGQYHGSSTTR